MAGPVYLNQNNSHNFDVIEKHLETLKQVNGRQTIKGLNYPILNTGEARNHYIN